MQKHSLWQQLNELAQPLFNLDFTPYLYNVVVALIIFFVGKWLATKLTCWLEVLMEKRVDHLVARFLANIIQVTLFLVVLIAALSQLGIETTSLVAILGAVSIAVGLSLKDSLSNFAAGVLLIVLRPFRIGDVIEAGSVLGTVKDIKIFATTLTTADNRVIIIPNNNLISQHITNHYAMPTRRIDMVIKVGHNTNLGKIKTDLLGFMEADQRILKTPAPMVTVAAITDTGIELNVRPWVESGNYWPVRWALTEKIKTHFTSIQLALPAQHIDVNTQNSGQGNV